MGCFGSIRRLKMSRNVPIKQPFDDGYGFFSRIWIKFFRHLNSLSATIVDNPTLPYNMVNENEIIFISTAVDGVVNLLPVADGLRCRVVNLSSSTANVLLTPNGTDLLYGVNSADIILPDEARDVDGNSLKGWY